VSVSVCVSVSAYVSVNVCVCKCVYICVCACVCVRMRARARVCVRVRARVCVSVCICVSKWKSRKLMRQTVSQVGRGGSLCVVCQLDLLRLYDTAEMTAAGAERLRRAHRALELAGAPRDPPARSAAAGSPHQPATGPRRGSPKAQKRTTVSPPRWLRREPPPLCPQPAIVEPNGEAEAAAVAVDSESAADEPALAQRVWI
jgi:hypothetical protein